MHGHHRYLQKLSCPIAYSNPLTNLVMQLSTPRSLLKPKPTFAFLVLSSLNTLRIQEGENQDLDGERPFAPFTIARHPHLAKKKMMTSNLSLFFKEVCSPFQFLRSRRALWQKSHTLSSQMPRGYWRGSKHAGLRLMLLCGMYHKPDTFSFLASSFISHGTSLGFQSAFPPFFILQFGKLGSS